MNIYDHMNNELKKYGKTIDDITNVYVYDYDNITRYEIDKEIFLKKCKEKEFINGYGVSKLNEYLYMKGKDFLFTIQEYDGYVFFTYYDTHNNVKSKVTDELLIDTLIHNNSDITDLLKNEEK